MTKPEWLVEAEKNKNTIKPALLKCSTCAFYGPVVKFAKCYDRKRRGFHACEIHKGCMNTELAYACSDYKKKS